MKRSKETSSSFTVAPPTVKVTAMVCDKCIVKIEKASPLWTGDNEWKLIDGNVLQHNAWSLSQSLQQGIP